MPPNVPQVERRRFPRRPVQRAAVIETAHDNPSQSTSTVEKGILDRIQKCLTRAYHPSTSMSEAKAALFVSQKLISQHNVSQADVMDNDDNTSKARYGGRSIVSITKLGGSSERVTTEAFAWKVARAMCIMFDCKFFTTDYCQYVHWTFFGIADNTVAAAVGFEMSHNKILEWACSLKAALLPSATALAWQMGLWLRPIGKTKRTLSSSAQRAGFGFPEEM